MAGGPELFATGVELVPDANTATEVTAAAVLTANQFVVGSDGARGVKTANTTITNPVNGAASAPAVQYTGTWFSGGTGTTTKPYFLVETTGATSTAWDTSGTGLGVNSATGFSGNLIDLQVNAASRFSVSGTGTVSMRNSGSFVWAGRGILSSPAAGTVQHGTADAASPVAQTIRVQSVVAGTADTAGVNATIIGSLSTGAGASGDIIFQTGGTGAGSTSQNTATTAVTIKGATQAVNVAGVLNAASGTATPAAGSTAARLLLGTTAGFGIYFGSGAPTVSAAQGSLYLRSDGTTTNDRMYVNTNGTTGWTAVITAT